MTFEHLDIAIALVVVMLAVSLLVTILTQMVTSVLGLRGSKLRQGISDLISTVHPEAAKHADDIADKVLNHPLISDSTVSRLDRLASLPSVKWLHKIPGVKWLHKIPGVKSLHKSWRLASAIRVEELIGAMHLLAESAKQNAKGGPLPDCSEKAMGDIVEKAKQRLEEKKKTVMHDVAELSKHHQVQVDQVLARIPDAARMTLGLDLESWFNPAMDRVSQKFAMHSRLVTIFVSVLLAFVLHLDTFQLWSLFSSNAELRASLVTSSDAMQQAAGRILQAQAPAPPASAPEGTTERQPPVTQVINPTPADSTTPADGTTPAGNTPAVNAPPALAATYHVPAIYKASLGELKRKTDVDADMLKALQMLPAPQDFGNREAARAWLETSLSTTSADVRSTALRYFDAIVEKNFASDTDRLLDRASTVRGILAETRFHLVPDPYPGWDYGWMHFWGTLATAALLSLGAPFWFNALKTLSSLKPIVASKAEQERTTA